MGTHQQWVELNSGWGPPVGGDMELYRFLLYFFFFLLDFPPRSTAGPSRHQSAPVGGSQHGKPEQL